MHGAFFPGTGSQNANEPADKYDLVHRVKHMYRLLDLYAEQGSGGLGMCCHLLSETGDVYEYYSVDKIVISQESVAQFINTISTGAYKSMTKINFQDLDRTSIRPIGVYGSKSEIVRLLLKLEAVDEETYVANLFYGEAFGNTDLASGRRFSCDLTTWR
jgi:hypothetical protein